MEYVKIVRAILGNPHNSIAQKISGIKEKVNVSEYKEALKFHPLFNKFLHRSPYFKSIDQIYNKEPFKFTGDFITEYKWLTNIIDVYLVQINSFIEYKNKFEYFFIIGEFEQANNVIIEVERTFGISLWSIEAYILIEEFLKGTEANWNKLSYYLKEINNPIYEFIINASSKRIELKLSYESFVNQFQHEIDSINTDSLIHDFFVFKNFILANHEYTFKNLESVLYVSNIFSVIDQYLILIDVIQYNVSISKSHDNLFLPFLKKAKSILINDARIINLYNVVNNSGELVKFEKNNHLIKCLNYYYTGRFVESLESSIAGINNSPLEFEYYEIYCKSLINLKRNFESFSSISMINEILEDTFYLLSFSKGSEESNNRIFKTALILMNMNFGKQIFGLLSEIEGNTNRHFITGFLSSSFSSHKNIFLANERNFIKHNFKDLEQEHCFKVFSYKLGYDIEFDGEISNFDHQNTIFKAVHYYNKKVYNKVIDILTEYKSDEIPYYYERKISLLFNSYLYLDLIKNALELFGELFFNDSIITRKLNYFDLYNKIRNINKREDINKLIECPILFSLITKEYDLYEVYDDFMCNYEIYNIREIDIDNFIKIFSLKKVIYFLNKVSTIDTLKYSSDYGSIGLVEEDRIFILNILIEIDPLNKLSYEQEINEIYRINSVRKVLKEVDEGRLYIDVNSLKEIQTKKFKEDFNRFKEIELFASIQNLIGFNSSNTKNWEKALTEKYDNPEKFNSADYLAFKSIYLESRENFLFSKEYGLDSCLSTRIRHGALKNHIRSVFEKLDLITSKYNDIYKDNEVWGKQLNGFPEINFNVQRKLKNFSQEIDDYIVFIREKLIQINTEKNLDKNEGLFNYFLNDELLYNFYIDNKQYLNSIESTIDIILTNLVNYTLLFLGKDLLYAFTEVIPKEFQKIIDKLIVELRDLNLPGDCQLISNLIKSNTEIQKELEYLSEWFSINTTSSFSLMKIETILDASIELTNRINPLFHLTPKITINLDLLGYSNLIFVFNILLNNIIKHSKLENDQLNVEIEVNLDETKKFCIVKFKNNLNPNVNFELNRNKLENVKQNWNDHSKIERSNKEGESGYDKIKRILLYEALAKTDLFDYELENNEITISLFFPYNKSILDEKDTNN